MSRKKKRKAAVPQEILAEGSGPVETATDVDALAAAANEALSAEAPVEELPPADDVVVTPEEPPPAEVAVEAAVEAAADSGEQLDDAAPLDVAAEPVEAAPTDALEELTDEEAAELGAVLPTSAASMDAVQLKYLVEALVFASDKPITVQRLRQLTRVSDTRRLEQALADVAEDHKDRGIVLQQVSGGYQFRTRTQFSAWVQQLIAGRPVRLSRAQLETLAIVAYRQPITRPEIDEIRGVDSSATLKLLLDRTLIRILGKKEEVGRPMLYGTTKEFLDFFSLGDLRELPTLREYSELTDESRRVMTDELGIDPDAAPVDTTASEEEMLEAEPAPMSIEDMVASYNTSMDTTTDEASTTGVFVTHEQVADEEIETSDSSDSTLEALAARRMSSDASDEDAVDAADAADAEAVNAVVADADAVSAAVADADAVSAADADAVDAAVADSAVVDVADADAVSAAEAAAFDAADPDDEVHAADVEPDTEAAVTATADAVAVDAADEVFAALDPELDAEHRVEAQAEAVEAVDADTVDAEAAAAADEVFAALDPELDEENRVEAQADVDAEPTDAETGHAATLQDETSAEIDAAYAALSADPVTADEPDSTRD